MDLQGFNIELNFSSKQNNACVLLHRFLGFLPVGVGGR